MIYVTASLVQFLRNELPGEQFYLDQREETALQLTLPDRCVKLMGSGGPSAPWLKYTLQAVQVLVRDTNVPAAAYLAKRIYTLLHGRFGLILPAALNVGGVNYSQVQTAQIKAVQLPYNLGQDTAGRTSFTTNYQIIYIEE